MTQNDPTIFFLTLVAIALAVLSFALFRKNKKLNSTNQELARDRNNWERHAMIADKKYIGEVGEFNSHIHRHNCFLKDGQKPDIGDDRVPKRMVNNLPKS